MDNEDFYADLTQYDNAGVTKWVNTLAQAATDPLTDAFTQCTCKHRLYLLKCLVEDVYKELPEFPSQEKQWEQQRLINLLKNS